MSLFSTLRARLLASYLLVVLLSLVAAALALSYLLQSYRDQLTIAQLEEVTVPVSVQVRLWLRQGETPEAIVAYLSEQTEGTPVRILLLNRNGSVLYDTARGDSLRGEQLDLSTSLLLDARRPQGGRFVTPDGRAMLFAIMPVTTLLPRPDSSAVAYLVVAQPEYFGATIAELVPRLLAAAAVAIIAAALIALAVANSLYRPIRKLTEASESMSRGDYDQRVPIGGPQELADLARSFNRMAAEVQRSRQVLRDFVADVSHELKTPLTAIRGFVQAMSDGTAGDEADRRKALGIVDEEARRLQGLVAELLDLSRIEAGQVAMARLPVRTAELVQYCLEIFSLRASDKGVRLLADVPADLVVMGDADRLEQLLNNLLDNAIRHTPAGGQIKLSARLTSPELVTLTVTDSGPGIPAAELSRLFERFYTGRGDGSGTGLGLAIAREIARAHGGNIVATSAPGAGTTFTVTLPAGRPERAAVDAAAAEPGAAAG